MTLHPSDRLVCVRNSAMMRTCNVQTQLPHEQEHVDRLRVLQTVGHESKRGRLQQQKAAGSCSSMQTQRTKFARRTRRSRSAGMAMPGGICCTSCSGLTCPPMLSSSWPAIGSTNVTAYSEDSRVQMTALQSALGIRSETILCSVSNIVDQAS